MTSSVRGLTGVGGGEGGSSHGGKVGRSEAGNTLSGAGGRRAWLHVRVQHLSLSKHFFAYVFLYPQPLTQDSSPSLGTPPCLAQDCPPTPPLRASLAATPTSPPTRFPPTPSNPLDSSSGRCGSRASWSATPALRPSTLGTHHFQGSPPAHPAFPPRCPFASPAHFSASFKPGSAGLRPDTHSANTETF